MSGLARAGTGSPLARRNPTVKLALLAVVSLVAMFLLDPVTPTVLYLVGLAAVAFSAGAAPRTLLVAHVPFLLFGLGVLVVNALSRPGVAVWQAGPLRVTEEGLSVGAALAARTLLIGVLAVGFLLSTDGVALMTSLHQNARLGARITYAVLAGYRMLQEMPREWSTIRHAHAVRAGLPGGGRAADGQGDGDGERDRDGAGVDGDDDGRPGRAGTPSVRPPGRAGTPAVHPPRGPRHLVGVVFTLLVVSVRKGERMAQALESRGLGLQPRTTWRPLPVTGQDWALAAGVVLVVAAVIAASAALGTLQGPGALFEPAPRPAG